MTTPQSVPFKGTKFAVVSAWGAGSAITAITNANPAVVTRTAHGLVDGDVVRLAGIVGMTELNGRICVVDALTADTFALIDVDSTNLEPYTSGGTVSKGVLSESCQVTGYQGPTGSTPTQSVATNCASVKSYGDPEPGQISISMLMPSRTNSFRVALESAWRVSGKVALVTTLPGDFGRMVDIGTVTQFNGPTGQPGGLWEAGAVIERDYFRIDMA